MSARRKSPVNTKRVAGRELAASPGSPPCASCPFLPQNHKKFGVVAERLCAKFGQPKPDFWACLSIRENVKRDAIESRRLQCHCTVYDAQMNPHPEASRLCAGLAAYLSGANAESSDAREGGK